MKHGDIRSGSILLDGEWNAKISNFEMSSKTRVYNKAEHVDDNDCHSLGYVDPLYDEDFLTEHSDIYSLGVILVEMLCGRLAWAEGCEDHPQSLGPLAFEHYNEKGNLDEMICKGIKEQIIKQSSTTFQKIAIQCLEDFYWEKRPMASDVVIQLKKALEFQEDYEIWEPKLPIDYKEIMGCQNFQRSTTRRKRKRISTICSLMESSSLKTAKWNGERNEMISSRMFSYKTRTYRWQSIQESRFQKVAQMFDILKLKIRIKVTTRFLSPGVNYGAYLIFKFCDTKDFTRSIPKYVNLKYKKGGDNSHTYFATWKDNKWMMIELCRFLTHKKDTNFEVLLESFSRYYYGNTPIYVEGIEFRVIDNVKNEEIKEVQQILTSNLNKDQLSSLNEVTRKTHLMLPAREVVYHSSNMKHFHLQPSAESRFQEVIELLLQQVFPYHLQKSKSNAVAKYRIFLLLRFQAYQKNVMGCIVLHRNKKEDRIIYFRSPNPWNLHENNSVPEEREDGWMEVKVLKFNTNNQLKNGCIPVNLKLITYEGTMSGLMFCGLEFRPV